MPSRWRCGRRQRVRHSARARRRTRCTRRSPPNSTRPRAPRLAAHRVPRAGRACTARGCRPTARASPGCATQDAIAASGSRPRTAVRRCASSPRPRRQRWRGRAMGVGCSSQSPRQVFALAMAGQGGSRAIAKLGGRWPRALFGVDPAAARGHDRAGESAASSRAWPKRWRVFRVDAHGRQTLLHEDARADRRSRVRRTRSPRVPGRAWKAKATRCCASVATSVVPALRCVDLRAMRLAVREGRRPRGVALTDVDSDLRRLARLMRTTRLHTLARRSARRSGPHGCRARSANAHAADRRLPQHDRCRATASRPMRARMSLRIEARCPDRNLRIEVGRGPRAQWLVHDRAPTHEGRAPAPLRSGSTARSAIWRSAAACSIATKPAPALPETRDGAQDRLHLARVRRPADPWLRARAAGRGRRTRAHRRERARRTVRAVPAGIHERHRSCWPIAATWCSSPTSAVRPDFGRTYMRAGNGDFGNGRVQQDIVEGVRVLAANGIGDVRRAGIVGASFGGYSTLQGVTFQPELFRAGVAAVPPADLGWVLRWYSRSVDQMAPGIPMSTSMRLLDARSRGSRGRARLRAQSPIANVQRVARPVLLLAGGDDERVPIRSVHALRGGAEAAWQGREPVRRSGGRHQLEDPRTREAYFYLIERLLHRRLGGAAPEAPDAGLRGFIDRNMLLRGSDFE